MDRQFFVGRLEEARLLFSGEDGTALVINGTLHKIRWRREMFDLAQHGRKDLSLFRQARRRVKHDRLAVTYDGRKRRRVHDVSSVMRGELWG